MLTPAFVRERIVECRDERLAYLAVHCHSGRDSVEFSSVDLASHDRGYPALSDITGGQVVGALVFATNAVAGDLWLPSGGRVWLDQATIVGRTIRTLYPVPPQAAAVDSTYHRQALIFGNRGQEILRGQKVGVIGAGGIGSLVIELLARLGVGHLVMIDPDRIETSNLSRVVGSLNRDAHAWLTDEKRPTFVQHIGRQLCRYKVEIAQRVALQANPKIHFEAIARNVVDDSVAQRLIDCDYLFLAADSMQARLVFNALVHQFCIPGVQVGAKVPVDAATGDVQDVFSVVRPVSPGIGCLWCNGLISPAQLQEEAFSEEERRRQRYVDDPAVTAPSVITLNAVAAAHSVNDYLFRLMGLFQGNTSHEYQRFLPRESDVRLEMPRKDHDCSECSAEPRGRLARGQGRSLPTRSFT